MGDFGIGIPEHLRSNPQYMHVSSNIEALKLAIQEGVTGTRAEPFPRNSGVGLSTLKEIAVGSEGRLRIISLTAMLRAEERGTVNCRQISGYYQGTVVGVTIGVRPGAILALKRKNGSYF